MLNVKITRLGVATYLAPDFPLIDERLSSLREAAATVRESGASDLVVNLEHVSVLDSASLEFLIDLHTELRQAGGTLKLAAADELCQDILAATRVDKTIPVFDDLEAVGRSYL